MAVDQDRDVAPHPGHDEDPAARILGHPRSERQIGRLVEDIARPQQRVADHHHYEREPELKPAGCI
jgi:hypothetical protein